MTDIAVHNSPAVAAPIGPYSHATIYGGLLFCTGQLPLEPDGELRARSPGEQAAKCLENLAAVCASAGTSLTRALRVGVYVTDIGSFAEVNEVYGRVLTHRPARTTIEVSALPLGASVELDAIVALP